MLSLHHNPSLYQALIQKQLTLCELLDALESALIGISAEESIHPSTAFKSIVFTLDKALNDYISFEEDVLRGFVPSDVTVMFCWQHQEIRQIQGEVKRTVLACDRSPLINITFYKHGMKLIYRLRKYLAWECDHLLPTEPQLSPHNLAKPGNPQPAWG